MSQKSSQGIQLLVWVLLAAVAGGVLYWDVKREEQEKKKKETSAQLFQFGKDGDLNDSKALAKIRASVSGFTLKAKGNTLVLQQKPAQKGQKAQWVFTSPIQAKADTAEIKRLLDEVIKGKQEREVSTWTGDAPKDNKLFGRYGLSKPKMQLTFTHGAGKDAKTYTLSLGDKMEVNNQYFAYLKGSKKIITVGSGLFYALDKSQFNLRNKQLFTNQTAQIEKFTIKRNQGKNKAKVLKMSKQSRLLGEKRMAHWAVALGGVNYIWGNKSTIDSMISSLRYLKANKFVSEDRNKDAKQYGLHDPSHTVEVYLADLKKTKVYHFSTQRKKGKKKVYMAAAQGGPIALVGDYILNDLNKKVDDVWEKNLLRFNNKDIHMVRLITPEAPKGFRVVKLVDKVDTWRVLTPEPSNGIKSKAEALLNALREFKATKLHVTAMAGKDAGKYGLDKPSRVYEVYSNGGKTLVAGLYVGNKVGTNYLVTNLDKNKVFLAKAKDIEKFGNAPWQFTQGGKPPKRRTVSKPTPRIPAKRDAAPAKRDAAPAKRDAAPARRAPAPQPTRPAPIRRAVTQPAPAKAPLKPVAPAKPATRTAPSSRPAQPASRPAPAR